MKLSYTKSTKAAMSAAEEITFNKELAEDVIRDFCDRSRDKQTLKMLFRNSGLLEKFAAEIADETPDGNFTHGELNRDNLYGFFAQDCKDRAMSYLRKNGGTNIGAESYGRYYDNPIDFDSREITPAEAERGITRITFNNLYRIDKDDIKGYEDNACVSPLKPTGRMIELKHNTNCVDEFVGPDGAIYYSAF